MLILPGLFNSDNLYLSSVLRIKPSKSEKTFKGNYFGLTKSVSRERVARGESSTPASYKQYPAAQEFEIEIMRRRLSKKDVKYYHEPDVSGLLGRYGDFMNTASIRINDRPLLTGKNADQAGKHKRLNATALIYRCRRKDPLWPEQEKQKCLNLIKTELEWAEDQPAFDYANTPFKNNIADTFVEYAHKHKLLIAYNAIYPDTDMPFKKKMDTWFWNIMQRCGEQTTIYNLARLFGDETWENLDAENYSFSGYCKAAGLFQNITQSQPLFKYHHLYSAEKDYPTYVFNQQWSNRSAAVMITAYGIARHFSENGFYGDRTKLCKFTSLHHYTPSEPYTLYFDFDKKNQIYEGYTQIKVSDKLIRQTIDKTLRACKLWCKTAHMFAQYGNGMLIEMYRGHPDSHEIGWNYSTVMAFALLYVAESFARHGDYELITFSTKAGKPSMGTGIKLKEPNKSLYRILEFFAKASENHPDYRYYISKTKKADDPDYRINGISLAATNNENRDLYYKVHRYVPIYNLYAQNPYLESYARESPQFIKGAPDTETYFGQDDLFTGLFGVFDCVSLRYERMKEELTITQYKQIYPNRPKHLKNNKKKTVQMQKNSAN
jgi:hypothetical protein